MLDILVVALRGGFWSGSFQSDLLAEQFLKERIKSVELGGKGLRLDKPFRHEHILANENQIGHHHRYRPEQHLRHTDPQ